MKTDLKNLYSNTSIQKLGLPVAEKLEPEEGMFRKLRLVWSEIEKEANKYDDLAYVLVCCDTLVLDKRANLNVPPTVFARRIEVVGDAYFTIDRTEDNLPEFLLVTQEIVDSATGEPRSVALSNLTEEDEYSTEMVADSTKPATGYVLTRGEDLKQAQRIKPGFAAQDFLSPADPLPMLLKTLFQVACLISTDDDELAAQQLLWIAELTSTDSGSNDLSADAQNLYQTILSLRTQKDGTVLVPQIDHSVYAEASKACMELLRDRFQRYETLQRKKSNDENWQASFETTLEDKNNEFQLTKRLEEQAKNTCEDTEKARQEAANLIMDEKQRLSKLQTKFDRGVEDWRRDETIKGAIDIAVSVGDLLTQIPAIVASGGTLVAMPITSSLNGVARSSLDIAREGINDIRHRVKKKPAAAANDDDDDAIDMDFLFGDDIDNVPDAGPSVIVDGEIQSFEMVNASPAARDFVSEYKTEVEMYKAAKAEKAAQKKTLVDGAKAAVAAGKDVKGIYDGAMRIVDAAATAERLEAQSKEILTKVSLGTETSFGSIEPIGIDVVTGGAQVWDNMLIEMELVFDKMGPLLQKISGGLDYRASMRKLVMNGKVMSAARLALAKACSDLADAKMRVRSAQDSIRIYQIQLEKMTQKIARDEAMEQLAFGRILDSKRSLYQAMEAYIRAFTYFTLNDKEGPSLLPKITDDIPSFANKIQRITGTWLTDISLGAAPQSMKLPVHLDPGDMEVDADGNYNFTMDHSNPAFSDFHRIRLSKIRVYLEGYEGAGAVSVNIRSSGNYDDKGEGGRVLSFISQPFIKNFVYDMENEDDPIVDADVIDRFERDFFQPTPFSHWSFRFKTRDGQQITTDQMSAIRLELHGNTISNR